MDYEMLRLIWWGLLGVLLIGFAVTDGFDLGVATVLPFIGRTDTQRRVIINTVGPVWEGNQVWLILGGGAIFAAWPYIYAVSFSGFYLAMFVVLAALILRPVGFKYRSKRDDPRWRAAWDWALFIGGAVPALIFGVAVGNALVGVPFTFDDTLRLDYQGGFFGLLNPFALLCGLVSVAMLVLHGCAWLVLKTEGEIQARARRIGTWAGLGSVTLYLLAGGALALMLDGYRITSAIVTDGPSNPLLKEVARDPMAWFANYQTYPWMIAAPVLGVLGTLAAVLGLRAGREVSVLLGSKLGIAGIIASVGASMFPFILPSSSDPGASLTVWDSSSSELTLMIMLIVTALFMPLILLYTAWVYKVLWGKVTETEITRNAGTVY